MTQSAVILAVSVLALITLSQAQESGTPPSEEQKAAATKRWEKDITALEAKDSAEKYPEDSVLFIGSSSIRLWKTIAEDVAPYHPIQRGYGGAKFSDVSVFAERLITPHNYRAMVIFVANDIVGKDGDATPEQVLGWFRHVVAISQKAQPDAPIFFIAVTPTSSRWEVWPRALELNKRLEKECQSRKDLHFIPTASSYLNAEGTPRDELFVDDKLHLNRLGYHIWGGIVTSHLDRVLGQAAGVKK